MNNLRGSTYFLDEKKIYRPTFADFMPIRMVEMPDDPFDITGRNANDLFLNSRAGFFHHNGENTVLMIEISENRPFKGVRNYLIFENEIFFNVVDMYSGDNILYHGRLEEAP